jgi:hypothetical protein
MRAERAGIAELLAPLPDPSPRREHVRAGRSMRILRDFAFLRSGVKEFLRRDPRGR